MASSVIIKPDGTKEITYNDNKVVKIRPTVDVMVYKCPHVHCSFQSFRDDDMNQHRVVTHAELPKNMVGGEYRKSKYFSRSAMRSLNVSIQKERFKHVLLVMGMDLDAVGKPLLKRIRDWFNARRNKA